MKRLAITYGRLAIGLGFALALGWLSARGLDWGEVVDTFSDVSAPMLALSLAVFMGSGVLRAARWQMLFIEPRPSIARLFVIQHVGLGLGNIMPIRVTSELAQITLLTLRDGLRASAALAAISMERAIDFVTSALIFGIALIFVAEMKPLAPYAWAAIALGLTFVAALQAFAWRGESVWLVRRFTFLLALSQALKDLALDPFRLLRAFTASVGYWLMVGVSAWIAAEAVGLPISPVLATLVIIGAIFFSTVVPAPGGIGPFEFALVTVLGIVGVAKHAAFPFAVIIHALFFLPPVIIAAIALPREGLSFGRVELARKIASAESARAHGEARSRKV